ncbi:uncharacterized protein [Spinacia oleracea]|uniref:Uncharacterized protein isoform X2 n=1 Tax=Spinacia oleracea TaxID=3562 RepID=A0A9R0I5I1_SPIOL|nr:uncharacterized protein LOC110782714 isoform X2 [Spinacia oleracea]
MDTLSSLSTFPLIPLNFTNSSSNNQTRLINQSGKSLINYHLNPKLRNSTKQYYNCIKVRQLEVRVKAIDDVSGAIGDPAQAQLTWQIIVGSLAGVIPFIVAGIEFSKRIGVFYHGNLGKDSFRDDIGVVWL